MHGYQSKQELIGINIFSIDTEESNTGKEARIKRLQAGETLRFEVLHHKKDGTEFPLEASASLIELSGHKYILAFDRDITERKKTEQELQNAVLAKEQTFDKVIELFAQVLGSRDPYTVEHQQETAEISRLIAEELALDKKLIDQIYLAAKIHDFGKISVPQAILTKRSKLQETDLDILQEHTTAGYNLIKDKLDYPIPDIIHQHHEKLDGSGYPKQLKADAIHLGAKIVAVADVFQAIAAWRPYRPALGIAVAMDELIKNSGILYDPQVVAALQKLVKTGKISIKQTGEPSHV